MDMHNLRDLSEFVAKSTWEIHDKTQTCIAETNQSTFDLCGPWFDVAPTQDGARMPGDYSQHPRRRG